MNNIFKYICKPGLFLVALMTGLFVPNRLQAKDYVIISEIMYDSPLNEQIAAGIAYSNGEFIELYNTGVDSVDITGWSLKGGGSTEIYSFPDNTILAPQSYLIVAYQYYNSGFTLDQLYDGFITDNTRQVQYQRKIILSNSGEALKLRTPAGITKDSIYVDGTTHKTKPDRLSAENADSIAGNECVSLQRVTSVFDSLDNAIPNNQEWITATVSIYAQTTSYKAPAMPGVSYTSISSDQNYIISVTPLDATDQVDISSSRVALHDDARGLVSIQYFDGLGRPVQTVQQGITPQKSDLVTLTEYDPVGREFRNWLPAVVTGNNATFVDQTAFESAASDTYDGDSRAYNEIGYEPSPLNRVTAQYGAGEAWQNHPVSIDYDTNDGSIAYYYVNTAGNLVKGSNYAPNMLYKIQTADEDNKTTTEYKNKLGQVILKQSSTDVQTYYVYNDLGQLSYVLPPLAADHLTTQTTYFDDNTYLEQYAYLYKYDERGNCIQKRLPGCDWIYMVYDEADRLILSQDGNQRPDDKWTQTTYDGLGRVLYSLEIQTNVSLAEMRFYFSLNLLNDSFTSDQETGTIPDLGYNIFSVHNFYYLDTPHQTEPVVRFSFTLERILTINYYDDYNFLSGLSTGIQSNLAYTENEDYGNAVSANIGDLGGCRGLLTGTRTYLLDGSGSYTATAMYYDYRGRVIQTRSSNYLGGYDITYNQYDFSGQVTQNLKTHNISGQSTITELYTNTYDHAGRLLKTKYKLNDNPEIVLADMSAEGAYDELGRVQQKKRHNSTDNEEYDYNIRSWTTKIKSGDFEENLYYNSNPSNQNLCYNGNISCNTWTYEGTIRGYKYTYDGQNRLTSGSSTETTNNGFDESFYYDKMGNITALRRYKDDTCIDALTMNYSGNQLINVSDEAGSQNLYNVKEYNVIDHSSSGINSQNYDDNGNLTDDYDRNIATIRYNILNLPDTIQFKSGSQIINHYNASGDKLKTDYYTVTSPTIVPIGTTVQLDTHVGNRVVLTGTAYIGNIEYTRLTNESLYSVARIHNAEGYVTGISDLQYYYYRCDHLGNNREVWLANTDSTVQYTQYYPSGLPWASNTGDNPDSQPYKYNGKEFVEMHGWDTYDYFFRNYYPAVGRMTTVDPYAERHYSDSPYTYCFNNFINVIDPLGLDTTYVVSTPLPEVTCTPETTWTSESHEWDYGWSFSTYQTQYSEFSGMTYKEARNYWQNNYSKDFFAAWQKRIDYENGLELMYKMGWAQIILTTVPLTAAIDAVNTNLQLGRLSPRTISLPGNYKTKLGNLGNPFKNSTLSEIDDAFQAHVNSGKLELKYMNPITGQKAYLNTKSGYSYNLDPGGMYGKKLELPHIDVNYPNPKPLNVSPKIKLPVAGGF